MGSREKEQQRVNELLRSNDQIYQELRRANEKYLNQRVDNNKLKDEIQSLHNSLEEANLQLRKLQSANTLDSSQKQQIRLKSRPNRHDQLNTSGNNNRTNSNTSG